MDTRIISIIKFGALACTATLTVACSNSKDEPGDIGATSQAVTSKATPATLSAYKLVRLAPTQSALAEQAGRVGRALGLDSTSEQDLRAAIKGVSASASATSVHAQSNNLTVSHLGSNNNLDVLDETVTGDTESTVDVGVDAAKKLFLTRFDALVSNGAIDSGGLKVAAAKLFPLMQGEGMTGQPSVERVKEYIYSVPRVLDGVEVFGSGVEVSIHRNGKVARVRSFGPIVSPQSPTPAYTFSQAVPSTAADARVKAEYPDAEIKPIGLRYWLPEGAAEQVLAPEYMYLVVRHTVVDGRDVSARGVYVAYSAQDAAAAPTVWPKTSSSTQKPTRK